MKIAVPDLISNSYFPAVAAVELGKFAGPGIDASVQLLFPRAPKRSEIDIVKGKRIGAAPWVEMGLRRLLIQSDFDLDRDKITIAQVPATGSPSANFGFRAAEALQKGLIDGFWANGMGAKVAVRSGAGTVVLDFRREDGPPQAFYYTMASLAVTDRFLAENGSTARKAIRAIDATHRALKADVSLATQVGKRAFPSAKRL